MIRSQPRAIVVVAINLMLLWAAARAEFQITVGPQGDAPTLSEGIFKARAARKTNAAVRLLISGTQYLASPIYLGPEDSGLSIEGAGKGATISGGRLARA